MDKKEGQGVRIPAPVGHVPRKSLRFTVLRPGRKRLLPGQLRYRLRK
nr:MAG TPA: hypothetical protein [Caudoviricetes sp.]